MIIKELRVKNYRSIKDATLTLGSLTALVGRNGAGKSNFLNALELFFDQSKKPEEEDYFGRKAGQPIEVEVTFVKLDDAQRERYGGYVNGDELTVARVLELGDKQARYYGSVLQHPKFAEIRQSASNQTDKRTRFNELVDAGEFPGLTQPARSWQRAEELMNEWEDSHRDQLKRIPKRIDQKETQFFGFAGGSLIGQDINVIRVPAVREAQDDANDKGQSPVAQLMEAVVRRRLADRPDYRAFVDGAESDAKLLMSTLRNEVIGPLQDELNTNMRMYAPLSTVGLELSYDQLIEVKPPRAGVLLEEDGFATDVGRSGHGVQRAFIFAALQQLSSSQRATDNSETSDDDSDVEGASISVPTTILAIDEPELYQHPSRQRHIASTLRDLASGGDDGPLGHVQIIFTTHSPHFVSLDRCDDVRVIAKAGIDGSNPAATEAKFVNIESLGGERTVGNRRGAQPSLDAIRTNLAAITSIQTNEGFFAAVVVLVEGDTDKAVLKAIASSMNCDFDAYDVAVVPVGGKGSLVRPLRVFMGLGIPTYVVWDGDGSETSTDRKLRALLGMNTDDESHRGMRLSSDIETTLELEFDDDLWQRSMDEAIEQLGIPKRQRNKKSPVLYETATAIALGKGATSSTLERVVQRATALRPETL